MDTTLGINFTDIEQGLLSASSAASVYEFQGGNSGKSSMDTVPDSREKERGERGPYSDA